MFLSGAKHLEEKWKVGKVVQVLTKQFPDGETYVRVDVKRLDRNKMYVVQTPYPEQDRKLMELLFACHVLKDHGVKDITCVLPYYAYSRQDKRFLEGETISSLAVLELLSILNVKEIITIDAHFMRTTGKMNVKGILLKSVTAVFELISAVEREFGKVEIVTPDFGGSKWLEMLGIRFLKGFKKIKVCKHCGAEVTKCSCDAIRREYDVKVIPEEGSLKGKNVLVLDDIIAGGGTMAGAARILKEDLKCDAVICAATHGLFVGDGYERVAKYADEIVVTDTVAQKKRPKLRVVSIIPVLEEAIWEMQE